ncbi:protein of unknown function [Candidatus Promineifilum breve]|uniref:Uncharacterized protein n=1 Tax=Candidatus Promineifilum breve TaxID=1806508 RepID=A0A160T5H3_9CHLR|nr:protein of unknown function [Candidatus Promineifilum breve]
MSFAQAEQSVSAVAARDMFAKAKLKNERERGAFIMVHSVAPGRAVVKKSVVKIGCAS